MSADINPSTLNLSNATVNPGDSVVVSINMESSELNHKIVFSLGSKTHSANLATGVSTYTFEIPKTWANQLSGAVSGTVNVKLTTCKGTETIGTSTATFKLVIPETNEYCPTFDLVITRNDNGVPSSWNEYVKGISTVTVTPENIEYKNGASVGSVMIKVGKITKTEIPATFDLPNAGNITVKVTVKDSRGLKTIKTHVITVRDYAKPSVDIKSLTRCDSSGSEDSYGTYGRLSFEHHYSTVNAKNNCSVVVRYGKSGESEYMGMKDASNSPLMFGVGSLDISSTYKVSIVIKDNICTDGIEVVRYISSANIPFNIRPGGKGVAFGKFSENDELLEVAWDTDIKGNLNVGGLLNFEKLTCNCTEKAEDFHGVIRYYPWLNMVYLRMRLTVATGLAATDTHYLAQISTKVPAILSPVSTFVGIDSGGQSNGAVLNKTGYVVLRSDKPITTGTFIYINGWYPADTTV